MKTINLLDTNVLAAYNNADANGKKLLKNLVNGQVDFDQKITDRVKSYGDACVALGLPVYIFSNGESPDEVAYMKLKTIIKALNEGWVPDWENSQEYKYYPWWQIKGGFELYYVDYYYSTSFVSSRLCFKNRELAEYAAKQFKDLYKDYMLV